MYRKVVVGIDSVDHAPGLVAGAKSNLAEGGKVVLVHMLPGEEAARSDALRSMLETTALEWMQGLAREARLPLDAVEPVVSFDGGLAGTVAKVARKRAADAIAVYGDERKGIGKLFSKDIPGDVRKHTSLPVLAVNGAARSKAA